MPSQWKFELRDFYNDMQKSLLGICCPCVIFGNTSKLLKDASSVQQTLCYCCSIMTCTYGCVGASRRNMMVRRRDLPHPEGYQFQNFKIHCFAPCCALIQEAREAETVPINVSNVSKKDRRLKNCAPGYLGWGNLNGRILQQYGINLKGASVEENFRRTLSRSGKMRIDTMKTAEGSSLQYAPVTMLSDKTENSSSVIVEQPGVQHVKITDIASVKSEKELKTRVSDVPSFKIKSENDTLPFGFMTMEESGNSTDESSSSEVISDIHLSTHRTEDCKAKIQHNTFEIELLTNTSTTGSSSTSEFDSTDGDVHLADTTETV